MMIRDHRSLTKAITICVSCALIATVWTLLQRGTATNPTTSIRISTSYIGKPIAAAKPQSYEFHTLSSNYSWKDQFSIPLPRRAETKELKFEQSELNTAIDYLGLPNWTRSYQPCTSPSSPVSCSDIIRAYRAINSWETSIRATSPSSLKYIKRNFMNYGAMNTLFCDIMATAIAIYTKRAVALDIHNKGNLGKASYSDLSSVTAGDRNYAYPPGILYGTKRFDEKSVSCDYFPDDFKYRGSTIDGLKHTIFSSCSFLSHLYFPIMLYQYNGIGDWLFENFGSNMVYFLANYISRIPKKYIDKSIELVSKVPKTETVIGVHLRFEYSSNFLYNSGDRMKKAIDFLDAMNDRTQGHLRIISTSDGDHVYNELGNWLGGKYTIAPKRERIPGGNSNPDTMMDIALLMNSDLCLLTTRSTYSMIVSYRTGIPGWYLEAEGPCPIRQMSYMGFFFDATYHSDTTGLGQAAMHLRNEDGNERLHRKMFEELAL